MNIEAAASCTRERICRVDHCRTTPLAEGAQKLVPPVGQWKLEEAKLGSGWEVSLQISTPEYCVGSYSVSSQALARREVTFSTWLIISQRQVY